MEPLRLEKPNQRLIAQLSDRSGFTCPLTIGPIGQSCSRFAEVGSKPAIGAVLAQGEQILMFDYLAIFELLGVQMLPMITCIPEELSGFNCHGL